MEKEKPNSNMPYSLKREIGKLFMEYHDKRWTEIPTSEDKEELHFKYARKAIQILKNEGKVIAEYQKFAVDYHKKEFGTKDQEYRLLLGCGEELGELFHAHLKGEQKIRHTPKEILHKKKDSIGDLMMFLLNYCHTQKIDIMECLEIAKKELEKRKSK